MRAEVISIGDELTSGQRLDTNSQWLSERLGELGVPVLFHTTVADDLPANVRVFREALDRADLVLATGGLGPTADDLTRQALAEAVGLELLLDEPSLAHIRAIFARRGREMPERNIVQAYFPRGAQVVPNPNGTAPGIDLTVTRPGRGPARVFALPGVPAEMHEMWRATVAPAIAAQAGPTPRVIRHRRVKCFGVGESDLEQMLPDLIRRGRTPSVGITVHKATITLRITAQEGSEEDCLAAMQPTLATIRECLGQLVFGEEDEELEHAVVRLLAARRQTLATRETDTGGLAARWLSAADPAGGVYLGGAVERAPRGKGHPDEPASVKESAREIRERYGADYGLALGPFPSAAAGAGSFLVALASGNETVMREFSCAGHPDIIEARAAKQALNLLRLALA